MKLCNCHCENCDNDDHGHCEHMCEEKVELEELYCGEEKNGYI
jgi:hypothetical protein